MRTQRFHGVEAVLDGDTHCHVWAPNVAGSNRLDLDLTKQLAFLVHHGRDAPPAPEPHWTDRGGLTIIIELDTGSHGRITIDGHEISVEAATRLAADGFVRFLRDLVDEDAAVGGRVEASERREGPEGGGSAEGEDDRSDG